MSILQRFKTRAFFFCHLTDNDTPDRATVERLIHFLICIVRYNRLIHNIRHSHPQLRASALSLPPSHPQQVSLSSRHSTISSCDNFSLSPAQQSSDAEHQASHSRPSHIHQASHIQRKRFIFICQKHFKQL